MNPLRALAGQWLGQARPAMVVTIARHQGSTPREAGTRMLVSADELAGTIGGGRLEFEAVAIARQALAGAGPANAGPIGAGPTHAGPAGDLPDAFERRFALGPSLGQCCGGAVLLAFEPLTADALAQWPDDTPLFHLQLYGAGHVGRELVHLLSRHPCQIDWIDERAGLFPPPVAVPVAMAAATPAAASAPWPDSPAVIRQLALDAVPAEVAHAPPGALYLVMTHSHDLDQQICEAVLRRGDFGLLGLIGSATKRARFLTRLAGRGVPADRLARLTCPIGLPGIGSKRPEAIALAVAAQLLSQDWQAASPETRCPAGAGTRPAQPAGEMMQN